jgi:Phosphotransferase enzyme family
MSARVDSPGPVKQVHARVAPILGVAAHLGRGIQRVTTDAVLRGARDFPRRAQDLDPKVLSRIMGRDISSVAVIDGTAGTSSRARLALTGSDIPATVFVKMTASTVATRLIGELGRLGETEARFYRELSADIPSGVPRSYGSAFDSLTGRFVVVLEDLPADSCEFFDTLHPIEPSKVSLTVGLLAKLHGTFWGRLPETEGGAGQFGWLWSGSTDRSVPLVGSMMRYSARKIADRTSVPYEHGRFIIENYPQVARLIDATPHTVLHGDSHPGNIYFRNGEPGLLDWQAVRRGHPSRDLAYHLVLGMDTADRRANERELVDDYRQALAAAGGPEIDRDEMWLRYRQGMAYAYVSGLTTAGLGGMQAEDVALRGLQRAVAALDDLDTVAALQKSL